jgi:hypothetical protein
MGHDISNEDQRKDDTDKPDERRGGNPNYRRRRETPTGKGPTYTGRPY